MTMGYSTPKKQLDLKEFLAQPAKKPAYRNGLSFRKLGTQARGSTVPAATAPKAADGAQES
ncbi:hypothetical protein [Rhodobacter capsulatus]|nr:hypothetical protein [Rhodobacter capsulatus]